MGYPLSQRFAQTLIRLHEDLLKVEVGRYIGIDIGIGKYWLISWYRYRISAKNHDTPDAFLYMSIFYNLPWCAGGFSNAIQYTMEKKSKVKISVILKKKISSKKKTTPLVFIALQSYVNWDFSLEKIWSTFFSHASSYLKIYLSVREDNYIYFVYILHFFYYCLYIFNTFVLYCPISKFEENVFNLFKIEQLPFENNIFWQTPHNPC